jgi:hypothetical protein
MHNYIIKFSDLVVENGEVNYLKCVKSRLTNVNLTCSKKDTLSADNVI